jgi:hypothetical protein
MAVEILHEDQAFGALLIKEGEDSEEQEGISGATRLHEKLA